MKSILRPSLAAATLLLAPVATLLMAGPAAADHRVPTHAGDSRDWTPHHRDDRQGDRGWERRHRRDRSAPEITRLTPDHGGRLDDRGRARIAVRFHDFGSGIDVDSVSLRLNGRDLTRFARVDEDGVRLRADLAPGRHFAEVVVRDRAGNASRQAWSFDVVDRHGWQGHGYAPAYRAPQRW